MSVVFAFSFTVVFFFYIICYCFSSNSLNRQAENRVKEETNGEEEGCSGWTVCTRRKSKSPAFKPTRVERARERPSPGRINDLDNIDLNSSPVLGRQYSSDSDCNSIANGLQSPENGEIQVNKTAKSRAECPVTALALQDLPRTSPQASSHPTLQSAEASGSPPANESLSPPLSSNAGVELRGPTISPSPPVAEQPPAQNSSFVRDGNPYVTSTEPNANVPTSTAVPSSSGQQQQNTFFPVPPFPFQIIPTQVITQYLNSLVVQPNIPQGSRVPNSSTPLRRPPGLNTEPVPEEDPDQVSPPARPAGKLTSFDKLMDALHKRFPNRDR